MSTGRVNEGAALPGTRALLAVVIGMGVLIAAGVLVVVVTLVHRTFGGGAGVARPAMGNAAAGGATSLGEPPGSRIVSVSTTDGRLALLVSGGGVPDRIVLLDTRDGATIATIRLGPAAAVPR